MDPNVEYEMVFGGAENPTCVSPTVDDICFDSIREVPHQQHELGLSTPLATAELSPLARQLEISEALFSRLLLDMEQERAMMYNFTAIIHNQTAPDAGPLCLLRKTVDGYGHSLAQSVVHSTEGARYIEGIQFPAKGQGVGDLPRGRALYFPPTGGHELMYYFIVFYNELFGIVPEDGLAERQGKFVAFLLADWVGPFTP